MNKNRWEEDEGAFHCVSLRIDIPPHAKTYSFITVSLDPSENLVSTDVLARLSEDLAQICRVKVIAPCAAITLVGRGMRSLLHRLSDGWATFGQERVAEHEESSPSYGLLSMGLSYRLHMDQNTYTLYLRGNNLLNKLAYRHTSFIARQAPLMGRNILAGIQVEF